MATMKHFRFAMEVAGNAVETFADGKITIGEIVNFCFVTTETALKHFGVWDVKVTGA